MQTLVGTEPAAEERQPSKRRTYEAGARPEQRRRRLTPDSLAAALTVAVVAGCTAFVIWQLHPMTLLFTSTMDAGGDNAGHVAAPYYLIHHLLTHGQVSGWDPNWFDGFPLYVFYFPLPALLVAIFNLVMPYAVAFKLVTVAGSILMPGAAYLFGRLAGFRRPIPALMCAAMLPFLWNTSYTIDGGNLASTMAGEFSFTLSVTFGLVFLGLVANGLRTGRHRGLAGLLFACTILCHVVPALFFAFGALVLTAATGDWRRLRFLVPAGVTGALLAGFWLLPFAVYLHDGFSSSMGYTRVSTIGAELFPLGYVWVLSIALLGCIVAAAARDRRAIALGVMAGAAAFAFWLLPSGQVYNERWLPFWFLTASLLAGYGFGELVARIGRLLEFERWHETVGAFVGSVAVLVTVSIPIGALGFVGLGQTVRSFVPGWISWNYSGFQAKAGWNVFEGIVQMLQRQSASHGCGRLEYEYTGDQLTNQFGSTMAFMSLPMWTNSCIDTTEGLYFESSTTTPFHFLDEAQISTTPSNPVVGIPYGSYNLADGVRHLQLMGVRYLLAGSSATQSYADKDPSLQFLASTPGVPTVGTNPKGQPVSVATTWKLYLVKDAPMVQALAYEPVVEAMSHDAWLNLGIRWYQSESYWQVPIARGGPASWPRQPAGTLVPPDRAVLLPLTTVSNVVEGNESISFDVSRTGVPVEVKVPYFPNWQASGAQGPWEATPNVMVVVPTSRHVTLTYGTSLANWVGYGASAAGVGLVVLFGVRPPVSYERRRRRRRPGAEGTEGDEPGTPEEDAALDAEVVPAVPVVPAAGAAGGDVDASAAGAAGGDVDASAAEAAGGDVDAPTGVLPAAGEPPAPAEDGEAGGAGAVAGEAPPAPAGQAEAPAVEAPPAETPAAADGPPPAAEAAAPHDEPPAAEPAAPGEAP